MPSIFDVVDQSSASQKQTTATAGGQRLPTEQLTPVLSTFDAAQKEFEQGPRTFFPGSTVAGFTPNQLGGFESLIAGSRNLAPQLSQAGDVISFNLGAGRDPGANPFLQDAISAAVDPIQERLQQQILPSLASTAIAGGQFGGSRQALAESAAINDFTRNALNTAGQISFQDFLAGQQRALQSINAIPTLQSAALLPGQIQTTVGEAEQGLNQANINEQIARHQFGQGATAENIREFQNLLNFDIGRDIEQLVSQAGTSTGQQVQRDAGNFVDAAVGVGGLVKTANDVGLIDWIGGLFG